MATKCPECSKKFTARTALCDDWRDPNKAFGCPHCGTFYVKDMNPNKREDWIANLFAVGMMVPAANIVTRHLIEGNEPYAFVNAIFILVAAIIIIVLKKPEFFSSLEKSPYNKSVQPTAKAAAD